MRHVSKVELLGKNERKTIKDVKIADLYGIDLLKTK